MKLTATEERTIRRALAILEKHLMKPEFTVTSPAICKEYLKLRMARELSEVFVCIFLDAQHHVIAVEDMFRGTLTQTSVYPREVLRAALDKNAGAVIFAHNHPSGNAQPSQADEFLTKNLKEALAFIDVSVLDHFVVAGTEIVSFAERGLL